MKMAKKTIGKLFAIIALALTMLFSGVLIGCGERVKSNSGDQDVPPITIDPVEKDTDKENNDPDDGEEKEPEDEEYDPENIILVPPSVPSSGAHLSIGVEETNYSYSDDIFVDVLYGIDIKTFNGYWGSFKNGDEEYTTSKMCVIAYDMSIYTNTLHSVDDDDALYKNLVDLDVGAANNGVFLIDEIPITAEMLASENDPEDIHQCLNVKGLNGTKYECSVEYKQMYNEVVYNKKNTIMLPRELFASDSGNILFGIVLLKESNLNNVYVYEVSYYQSRAQIEYSKNDEQIVFSNARLGEEYRVNDSDL